MHYSRLRVMAGDDAIEFKEKGVPYGHEDLPPADYIDPVIEAYKKDVDRTMLRENLKLTTDERSRKFESAMELVWELRRVAAERKLTQR